jgi:predicted transcriptional regulator
MSFSYNYITEVSEVQVLIEIYSSLSRIEKRIFDRLQFYSRKHGWNYVSQSRIAAEIGCSRRWVNKCIKKLCDLNLISKKKRHAYTTCDYYFKDSIKGMNLKELSKDYYKFTSQNAAFVYDHFSRALSKILLSNNRKKTQVMKEQAKSSDLKFSKPLPKEIPFNVDRLPVSLDCKLKLMLHPEASVINATLSLVSRRNKLKPTGNEEQYLIGSCLRMAKQERRMVDWPYYYNVLKPGFSGREAN